MNVCYFTIFRMKNICARRSTPLHLQNIPPKKINEKLTANYTIIYGTP